MIDKDILKSPMGEFKQHINGLDDIQLLKLKDEINDEIDSIRGKIETAQAEFLITGIYADPDWYRRANGALRAMGRKANHIQTEQSIRNKKYKSERASSYERIFVNIAKQYLPAKVWQKIHEIAMEKAHQ